MDKILHHLLNKEYLAGVSILTPTGDRQVTFNRLEYYIKRQTYKGPLQWLVGDDGDSLTKLSMPNIQELVRNRQQAGLNINIRSLLPKIKYDKVIICEDDDWYSADYIEHCISRLNNYELVGENAKYYNVANKLYRIWPNGKHASFCQTALRAKLLDKLYVSTQKNSPFIDKRLWNKKGCSRFVFQTEPFHCIGIKGMPGRKGIGMGHRINTKNNPRGFLLDDKYKILTKWLGEEDTAYYKRFFKKGA